MKNKRIKCPKCGNLVLRKRGIKFFIKNTTIAVLYVFLFLTSIIGALSIYNFVVVGIYDDPNIMFTVGGLYSTLTSWDNKLMSIENKTILNGIANNLTEGCYTKKCKIKKVYDHLITFNFDEGSDAHNPLKIWLAEEGDCDEISNLAIVLLGTQNIKGHLVCNNVHCWTVFNADKEKILADMVWEIFEVRE